MLYLIDGYNVTKSDPATRSLSLEDQREALIVRMNVRGDSLLGKGRKILVFDGPAESYSHTTSGTVGVRFSKGESADEVIVNLARSAGEPVCVVTSDRELADRVKDSVAGSTRHIERERLFESRRKSAANSSKRYPARNVGLPDGANRITEELKGIWLKGEEE